MPPARTRACLLAALGLLAPPASAGELLYVAEGNRLHRVDLESLDRPPLRREVLIRSAADDPARGLDINGMVCALPDGSGRFVAGEDTGQPGRRAGWALLGPEGELLGKLVPSSAARQPEPYGCAFAPDGRLFTSEIGDPGFWPSNGQLILWFPPFDVFPGRAGSYPNGAIGTSFCKLATDLGTPGGVAVDARGRVYVASSNRGAIHRFGPPFPSGPDAEGGCGDADDLGSPQAERVQREVLVRGPATFSGLAFSARGTLYAASVLTGRIYEYDQDGELLRVVLDSDSRLPPHTHGTPQGLAVDSQGSLYYADLDLVRRGWLDFGPGPDGRVWRIRFDGAGEPLAPERVLDGLAFPDGLGVLPGELRR